MTDQELTDLEALLEKVTSGKWYVTVTGEGIPCVNASEPQEYHGCPVCVQGMILNEANLRFIAAARTAVPKLIEEVWRLKALDNEHMLTIVYMSGYHDGKKSRGKEETAK